MGDRGEMMGVIWRLLKLILKNGMVGNLNSRYCARHGVQKRWDRYDLSGGWRGGIMRLSLLFLLWFIHIRSGQGAPLCLLCI